MSIGTAPARLGRIRLGATRLGTTPPPIPPGLPDNPPVEVLAPAQDWHLYVRDDDRHRVAEIDVYGQLDLILRFNDVGAWAVDVPADSLSADLLSQPKFGLIAVRDGEVVMSGPATSWNFDETADSLSTLTVSGPDDNVWLSRRICLPDTAPYSDHGYDVQTGAGETVMTHYVSRNLGSTAEAARQLNGLAFSADQLRGATVTGRARFDNLLELLQKLALASGTAIEAGGALIAGAVGGSTAQVTELGFRIVQNGPFLEWQVYLPRDLRRAVEFSYDRGNVTRGQFSQQASEANYEIAGGGGQGTARTFREHGDDSSIARYDRIERFLDERGTTDHDELDQAIDEDLASAAEQLSLTVDLTDTQGLAFLRDWKLGDRVRAAVRNVVIEDIVREVNLTLSSDGGQLVSATVGSPGSQPPHAEVFFGAKNTARLSRRVSNIERSE